MSQKKYVFGYGSLASAKDIFATLGREVNLCYPVQLEGWVRDWSIALRNESNWRHFKIMETEEVPIHVAALNIRRPLSGEIATNPNGVLFEVTDEDLAALDLRESHYDRIDVTDEISGEFEGRVYTYVGQEQYVNTPAEGVIVPGSYYQLVEQSFLSLGVEMQERYFSSTISPLHPVHPTILV